jgi:antitoxin CcdA
MVDTTIRKPAPKRPTNISLSPDVYDEAKRLGINLSQACDRLLRDLIRQETAKRWAADNAEFIEAYNQISQAEGLPLDQWRSF